MIPLHCFRLPHWFVSHKRGHILAEAVVIRPPVQSSLTVLAAARLKASGGEMGSGPGSVAVPNGTGLEGGTVK